MYEHKQFRRRERIYDNWKLNGKKDKYLINFLEQDGVYISNSFSEDKVKENGEIETRTILKIGAEKKRQE